MGRIRMAQYGTKHGHAGGKLQAMLSNPGVEVTGVFEPDATRRKLLMANGGPFGSVHWVADGRELLDDPTIVAVASEGLNSESLAHTEAIVTAGKHVWYDKPAGDDWPAWQRVIDLVKANAVHLQMGYMFRYHHGFRQITEWARRGFLGEIFSIRAHMSTWLTTAQREVIGEHAGGIFYDLAGHMLDQIVWILGRPQRVTAVLRNDSGDVPAFMDNTLGVFEFDRALAFIDIAALETRPMARRFEVYGTCGSAILQEPFEPAQRIRLCLEAPADGYAAGDQIVPVQPQSRQELYDLELDAFLATITGRQAPDRPLAHDLTVQETLLRATGGIRGG